jgi:O-antigen chain-terminating methyltransferase
MRRRLAQYAAQVILYLSSFITNQQKQFNAAILRSLRTISDGVRSLEFGFVQREGQSSGLEGTINQIDGKLTVLEQAQHNEFRRLTGELGQRDQRLQQFEQTLSRLKTELVLQERRIGLLLEEARKRLPAPFDDEQLHTLADEEKHQLDALYLSFEDQFRGTREDIKDRLKVYLPLLHDSGIGTQDMPILDVGCGRGEWLEILHEAGLVVQRLDINHVLVEQCRQRGFEVAEGDVIAHLRSLPEQSVGAVTGYTDVGRVCLGTGGFFTDDFTTVAGREV